MGDPQLPLLAEEVERVVEHEKPGEWSCHIPGEAGGKGPFLVYSKGVGVYPSLPNQSPTTELRSV